MKTQVDYSKFNDIELKCLKALCDMGFAEAISVELVENDKAFVRRMEAAGFTMKFDEVVYRIIAMEGQAIEDRFYWIEPEDEDVKALFLMPDDSVVMAGPDEVVEYGSISDFICMLSTKLDGIPCKRFNDYEKDIRSGKAFDFNFDVDDLYPVEGDGGSAA